MNPSTELLGLVDAMEKSADLRYSPLFGSNHDYPKMAPLTQQQKHSFSEFSRKLAERARNFPAYPAFNDDPFDFAKRKQHQIPTSEFTSWEKPKSWRERAEEAGIGKPFYQRPKPVPRTLFGRPFEYRASTVKRPFGHRMLYC